VLRHELLWTIVTFQKIRDTKMQSESTDALYTGTVQKHSTNRQRRKMLRILLWRMFCI